MSTDDPNKKRFPDWYGLYDRRSGKELPWYFEDLDPDIAAALHSLNLQKVRLLDIGCGSGTQALHLARLGYSVTATDLSATAILSGQQLADQEKLDCHFIFDDIRNTQLSAQSFDIILDRGCFHVLAADERPSYIASLRHLSATAGYFIVKCFSITEPWDGGPYRFSQDQLEGIFSTDYMALGFTQTVYQGLRKPDCKAILGIFRKL